MTTGPWLVSLQMNPASRAVRADLADAGNLHRRVMSLVPDGIGDEARSQAKVLFRLEQTPRGFRVLAQTGLMPTLERIPPDYGLVPEPKPLDGLMKSLETGTRVRYRITANTSKRLPREYTGLLGKPGQVIALRGEDDLEAWWRTRGDRCGLEILTAAITTQDDIRANRESGRRASHAATRFDGIATIQDPEIARETILNGIGRGKSFGCGLLSIALIQQ